MGQEFMPCHASPARGGGTLEPGQKTPEAFQKWKEGLCASLPQCSFTSCLLREALMGMEQERGERRDEEHHQCSHPSWL